MESCGDLGDGEFIESDDLGLGFGLRPGGLPPISSDRNTSTDLEQPVQYSPQQRSIDEEQAVTDILTKLSSWKLSTFLEKITSGRDKRVRKAKSDDTSAGGLIHSCKKCQKSTTNKKGKWRRNSDTALDDSGKQGSSAALRRTKSLREKTWNYFQDYDYKHLQHKLQRAKEEIEILNCNLEHCQQELLDKYSAMRAITAQTRLEQAHNRRSTKKALEASKQLEQDVNMLQWELELKQSYMMDSEQTWAQRFDRVATENAALLVALHTRSDELRKLALDRIALLRERDELVAALEIKDRIQAESLTPGEDGPFSSEEIIVELATLGACQCRGHNQEPCACARAAVDAKRESSRLTKQMEVSRYNEDEARLTADAYRIAFDQQLNKNTSLIYELLHKSVPWTKTRFLSRKKPAQHDPDSLNSSDEEFISLMRSRDDRLVQRLVDMLSDKMEALAHQKMATKMLASKIREQERVIQRHSSHERTLLSAQDYDPETPVSV